VSSFVLWLLEPILIGMGNRMKFLTGMDEFLASIILVFLFTLLIVGTAVYLYHQSKDKKKYWVCYAIVFGLMLIISLITIVSFPWGEI